MTDHVQPRVLRARWQIRDGRYALSRLTLTPVQIDTVRSWRYDEALETGSLAMMDAARLWEPPVRWHR